MTRTTCLPPAVAAAALGLVTASSAIAGGAGGVPGAPNLLAAGNGASIVQRTMEVKDRPAANLLDDDGAATPWATPEAVLPQTVVFRLAGNLPFNTVALHPAGDPDPDTWARTVEVATADPFPHMGGWKEVAVAELEPRAAAQTFRFPRVRGRFVRVVISRLQGAEAPRASLGAVELYLR